MTTRFGLRFYVILVVVGVATFFFHELAHWLTGIALGYPMAFGMNGVKTLTPATVRDGVLIAGAGPVLTIVQGVVAFLVLRRRESVTVFAALIWAAVMRVIATGVSVFHPNDEARISDTLGLGLWTLPIVVSAGLGVLAWIGARRMQVGRRTVGLMYVVMSLTAAAIVLGDQAAR